MKEAGIIEFQWVSTVGNVADMFTNTWQGQNTINILQGCVDTINITAPCKTERVMSEGGCQESWRAHDQKSATSSRSENLSIGLSALRIK